MSVTNTAMSMPVAPIMLPDRAVAGELSRLRPTMNSTAESRYARFTRLISVIRPACPAAS